MSKYFFLPTILVFPVLFTAGPSAGGAEEVLLPGSRESLREAVHSSEIIVVVKVIEVGKKSVRVSAGKLYYCGYKLKAKKALKGGAPKEDLSTLLTLRTWPKETAETLPNRDKEYIFFLKWEQPTTLRASKVLFATDENIRLTSEAIRTENQAHP